MSYNISTTWTTVIIIAAVWEIAWKAVALWQAARRNQKSWYIAMVILNTVGILPIIYLVINNMHPHVKEQKS